ncbi:hypothetical protein GCM10009799_42010 [Nocardiopsis rhodophaea]|uniref:Uncharacterized protein n=1 Tax=Nocardiopsis rhodophaea TaxID=280238 RepID=A0ABN2THF3_9ACTN
MVTFPVSRTRTRELRTVVFSVCHRGSPQDAFYGGVNDRSREPLSFGMDRGDRSPSLAIIFSSVNKHKTIRRPRGHHVLTDFGPARGGSRTPVRLAPRGPLASTAHPRILGSVQACMPS